MDSIGSITALKRGEATVTATSVADTRKSAQVEIQVINSNIAPQSTLSLGFTPNGRGSLTDITNGVQVTRGIDEFNSDIDDSTSRTITFRSGNVYTAGQLIYFSPEDSSKIHNGPISYSKATAINGSIMRFLLNGANQAIHTIEGSSIVNRIVTIKAPDNVDFDEVIIKLKRRQVYLQEIENRYRVTFFINSL